MVAKPEEAVKAQLKDSKTEGQRLTSCGKHLVKRVHSLVVLTQKLSYLKEHYKLWLRDKCESLQAQLVVVEHVILFEEGMVSSEPVNKVIVLLE